MSSDRIKLRHLRCFLAVASTGGIGTAATALSLSQPAVTKTIKELETILGGQLMTRGRGGAKLTIQGEAFMPRAAACLAELDRAVESVSTTRSRMRWRVHVGAMPSVAASLMPGAVRLFQDDGPAATVNFVTGRISYLMSLLLDDELDLVVGHMPPPDQMAGFSFEHLYTEPFLFVVRDGHPLAQTRPCDIDALKHYEMILPENGSVAYAHVERLLLGIGLAGELFCQIETLAPTFQCAFLLETDAICVVGEGMFERELARGDLVALAIDTSHSSHPVGITAKLDSPVKPGVEVMKRAIHAEVAKRREKGQG
jgi:LysR family pca operon transcriptional activator